MLRIAVAGCELAARWEEDRSPRTVAFVRTMLPYESTLIQARWSGQAAWVPMGDFDVGDIGRRTLRATLRRASCSSTPAE